MSRAELVETSAGRVPSAVAAIAAPMEFAKPLVSNSDSPARTWSNRLPTVENLKGRALDVLTAFVPPLLVVALLFLV